MGSSEAIVSSHFLLGQPVRVDGRGDTFTWRGQFEGQAQFCLSTWQGFESELCNPALPQKFVTCYSWCLVKSSAAGLQPSWRADTLVLAAVAPAAIARPGRWPSKGFRRNRDSQLSQVVSPHWPFSLKKCIQAV